MSHWSRVLRRLNKRRKTTHAYHNENIGGSPVLLPNPHPGPIVAPAPVLTPRENKPMDIDARTHQPQSSTDSSQRWVSAEEGPPSPSPQSKDPASWGANFWVTIIDPQTQNHFYACPATGECSWDPPAGNFVLPPSTEGEWWELNDESRSPPVPYYHHTRTGETSWTRPVGTFVIPLGIVQTTTLGRRLSRNTHQPSPSVASAPTPIIRQIAEEEEPPIPRSRAASTTLTPPAQSSRSTRRTTSEYLRPHVSTLPPIPASPFTSLSAVDLPSHSSITPDAPAPPPVPEQPHLEPGKAPRARTISTGTTRAARSNGSGYIQGQSEHSLDAAAVEIVAGAGSGSESGIVPGEYAPTARMVVPDSTPALTAQAKGKGVAKEKEVDGEPESIRSKRAGGAGTSVDSTGLGLNGGGILISRPLSEQIPRTNTAPPAPARMTNEYPAWAMSDKIQAVRIPVDFKSGNVKIGDPIVDHEAAASMSPINHERARPIPVEPIATKRMSTGDHRMLPRQLAEDIQQFQVSDFARRYFSTHKTGLIFRRRVPVEQLMVWQKQPLTSPLLILNRSLHKDAVLIFKVIQRIMGDRERDRPVGVHVRPSESHLAAAAASSDPGSSPGKRGKAGIGKLAGTGGDILEEERWLLAEGIEHGELRDEIYCQVVKQLTDNPSPESTFRGWQLLCVLLVIFPPSKNFEGYLRSFMLGKIKQTEGRIDVMAKYCLHRLPVIAKKGPRGKPPTAQEITNAADSAFNPSTFGESLSAIMRLQERTYASSKVPIILPFLADGILALGGTKSEGIFRIPGDGDAVSDLRVRIDKGFYNLEGIDDCNVPASLFKLWLRELQEPLVPTDMYNACIESAEDPERVVALVRALPPNNRRVLLFVISFLQLFLPEHVASVTKMTSANLALVMAPNLLRCDSESMAVVFTNARFEHIFVHNLLVHLKCSKIDPDYVPIHGLGASSSGSLGAPRASQSRNRTKSHRDSGAVGGRQL